MFLSSRTESPKPISLVKPRLRLWSLMTGCGLSTPMSDHVPELK